MSLEFLPKAKRNYVELLAEALSELGREFTPEEYKDYGSPDLYFYELALAIAGLEVGLDDVTDDDVINPRIW